MFLSRTRALIALTLFLASLMLAGCDSGSAPAPAGGAANAPTSPQSNYPPAKK
jgi:hypothetical protein